MLSCFICASLESLTCNTDISLIPRKKQKDTGLRFGCLDTIHSGCTWFTHEDITPTLTLYYIITKCFLINYHVTWWLQMVLASESIHQNQVWLSVIAFVLCLPFYVSIINFTNPARICPYVYTTDTRTSTAHIFRLPKDSWQSTRIWQMQQICVYQSWLPLSDSIIPSVPTMFEERWNEK